jgi:Astacin (Peptidase family M12A)
MKTIVQAMKVLSTSTCIKFQQYDGTQKDYVVITSEDTGCHSSVGRMGGAQSLNLQYPGCTSVGEGNIFSKTVSYKGVCIAKKPLEIFPL